VATCADTDDGDARHDSPVGGTRELPGAALVVALDVAALEPPGDGAVGAGDSGVAEGVTPPPPGEPAGAAAEIEGEPTAQPLSISVETSRTADGTSHDTDIRCSVTCSLSRSPLRPR
jgi:hypothetical protein